MRTAGLSRRPWWAQERPDRDFVLASLAFALIATAAILAVALVVWSFAPASWQSLIADEQRTDATALTVVSLWVNNLLICCVPALAGVFAHRLVSRGRRGWAWVVVAVAALGATRSLLMIGLVGGLDPTWLAGAAVWWIPELAALGACCAAGWQAFRLADPEGVSRRLAHALVFAGATLALAAVVEVALT
ncbi:MAG: hypothetical protein M3401_15710 [Actinomycetota bacterium]|nr:hypothetical protein [Actinomycetota bacterium]